MKPSAVEATLIDSFFIQMVAKRVAVEMLPTIQANMNAAIPINWLLLAAAPTQTKFRLTSPIFMRLVNQSYGLPNELNFTQKKNKKFRGLSIVSVLRFPIHVTPTQTLLQTYQTNMS